MQEDGHLAKGNECGDPRTEPNSSLSSDDLLKSAPFSSIYLKFGQALVSFGANGQRQVSLPKIAVTAMFRKSRRSTPVSLKVVIKAQGVAEPLTCEGETIIVNLHGALISTPVALTMGMKIEIHVYLTDKHANAKVVYVDPEQPMRCGIALSRTEEHLGNVLPPEDWHELDVE